MRAVSTSPAQMPRQSLNTRRAFSQHRVRVRARVRVRVILSTQAEFLEKLKKIEGVSQAESRVDILLHQHRDSFSVQIASSS